MTDSYTSCTKIEKRAEKLGVFDLPRLTLYTQPRYVSMRYRSWARSFGSNCLVDAAEQFLRTHDKETMMCYALRKARRLILAPQVIALVEFKQQIRGGTYHNPANYYVSIDINAETEITARIVECLIQAQNGDPIGEGINWEKLEKVWKIRRDQAIQQWQKYLPMK